MSVVLYPSESFHGSSDLVALSEFSQSSPLSMSLDNHSTLEVIHIANREFAELKECTEDAKHAVKVLGSISVGIIGVGALTFGFGLAGPIAFGTLVIIGGFLGSGAIRALKDLSESRVKTEKLTQAVQSMRFASMEGMIGGVKLKREINLQIDPQSSSRSSPRVFANIYSKTSTKSGEKVRVTRLDIHFQKGSLVATKSQPIEIEVL